MADFWADTRLLSAKERGFYRDLLDLLFMYGPLENSHRLRAKLTGNRIETATRLWSKVDHFFLINETEFDHWRIAEERAHALDKSKKARQSAEARWNANASADAMQRARDPHPKPSKPKKSSPMESQKKGSRLPEDWTLPDEWRRWAGAHLPENGIDEQADRFRDYWIAVPGAKGCKLNWQSTWRNWVRRAAHDGMPANGASGKAEPVWKLTDAELVKLANERGIPTKGKTRQELIGALR